MKREIRDALVIGGGAAGMAVATELKKRGRDVILVERDHVLGGILNQCIHNGFGLHHFQEELTRIAVANYRPGIHISFHPGIGIYTHTKFQVMLDDLYPRATFPPQAQTGIG